MLLFSFLFAFFFKCATQRSIRTLTVFVQFRCQLSPSQFVPEFVDKSWINRVHFQKWWQICHVWKFCPQPSRAADRYTSVGHLVPDESGKQILSSKSVCDCVLNTPAAFIIVIFRKYLLLCQTYHFILLFLSIKSFFFLLSFRYAGQG